MIKYIYAALVPSIKSNICDKVLQAVAMEITKRLIQILSICFMWIEYEKCYYELVFILLNYIGRIYINFSLVSYPI